MARELPADKAQAATASRPNGDTARRAATNPTCIFCEWASSHTKMQVSIRSETRDFFQQQKNSRKEKVSHQEAPWHKPRDVDGSAVGSGARVFFLTRSRRHARELVVQYNSLHTPRVSRGATSWRPGRPKKKKGNR